MIEVREPGGGGSDAADPRLGCTAAGSYLQNVGVSRKFLRSILGVRTGTPNVAVLGELGRKEDLHVCPDEASWLMQGLQRERHAQTNQKPKQRHKTPNSIT